MPISPLPLLPVSLRCENILFITCVLDMTASITTANDVTLLFSQDYNLSSLNLQHIHVGACLPDPAG